MKLLLLGSAGFGNAGDEAMLAVQLADLREPAPCDTEIRVVSGNPDATLALHGVDGVGRNDPLALQKALRWCDALVVGGSLLQDVTSTRGVTFAAGLALAAGRLGKVVSWYAAGLGPLRRRGNQVLAARALRSADYLSVRDPVSLAVADELGVIGAELVADPVLGGVPGLPSVSHQRTNGRPRLAVALRSWADDGWFDQIVTGLTALAAECEIVLVPMQAGVDEEISAAVRRAVCANSGVPIELVEPDGGYIAALSALQAADVVLGMRLHALVAAAAAHRPIVPICYDPKIDAFAGQLGVVVAGSVPGGLRADVVVGSVRAAFALPDIARKEYAATVTDLARRCRLPARRTRALLVG